MNDFLLMHASYEEGYDAGLACGKLCAAQQILDELEELLTKKRDEFKQARDTCPEETSEGISFWEGRRVACADVLKQITKLKQKFEVL